VPSIKIKPKSKKVLVPLDFQKKSTILNMSGLDGLVPIGKMEELK